MIWAQKLGDVAHSSIISTRYKIIPLDISSGIFFLKWDVQFHSDAIVFLSQFTWTNVGYLFHLYAKGVSCRQSKRTWFLCPVQVFGFLSRHLVTCMTFATLFLNCVPGGQRFVRGTPRGANLKYLQWPEADLKVHPSFE